MALKWKNRIAALLLILLLSSLLPSCALTLIPPTGFWGSPSGSTSDYDILDLGIGAINDCLEDNAYYDYDKEALSIAAIRAYVAALDDKYAQFYTYEEYRELIAEGNGELHGIGIQVIATTVDISGTTYNVYQLISVYEDSPAMQAGLQPGDLLYAVQTDGGIKTVNELGFDSFLNLIRGEDGTTVTVSVFRKENDSYQSVTFSDIVRTQITSRSVTSKISETDPEVGIVKISTFDNTTPDQLIEAIDALSKQGIQKFVFDLRNNPGGYVTSVCRVLSFFLNKGDTMLSAVNKQGETETVYQVDTKANLTITESDIGKYKGIHATVIVNENTASAAEIFTANMMYYKVADVVGTKTFGKGIMQTTFSLQKYGYPGFLKITTHAYCDPSGWCYHDIGITPDHVIELSESAKNTNLYILNEADDAQLLRAIAELNS